MIWQAIVLIAFVAQTTITIVMLMRTNKELAKLLASRNFTEYSLGEARVAKATSERKPDSDLGYEQTWEREDK